ncbi:hypothetical protein, partial [Mycobacterium tuberculosis]|uniref:hypothetical protein n=1 Tax=Mycobacterium tuberculosis TaxID=1773 RepID=UPI001BDD704C
YPVWAGAAYSGCCDDSGVPGGGGGVLVMGSPDAVYGAGARDNAMGLKAPVNTPRPIGRV